jgi:flagellin
MIINHNIAALNTYRQLSINDRNVQKNLEKLSSGLRINRAADDAAGLAISEKMRAQINGLDQAQRNAQDGINLVQTAEGALNETHDILQRMRELAVQASNDTLTSDDRNSIQQEINQLTQEIDRIGNSTQFNTRNLLNGQSGAIATQQNGVAGAGGGITVNGVAVGANGAVNASDLNAALSVTAGADTKSGVYSVTITAQAKAATFGDAAAGFTGGGGTVGSNGTLTINGVSIQISSSDTINNVITKINNVSSQTGVTASVGGTNGGLQLQSTSVGSNAKISIQGDTAATLDALGLTSGATTNVYSVAGTDAAGTITDAQGTHTLVSDGGSKLIAKTAGSDSDGVTIDIKKLDVTTNSSSLTFDVAVDTSNVITLQIGANNTPDQKMAISIGDMRSAALGVNNLDLTTQSGAESAITAIDNAIKMVSDQRSQLGAFQNRLEHTINNLSTENQNLTTAESNIRDVDMAKEMAEYTKNNILSQAAQAMLAQANQQPQGVLQLLRG